MSSHHIVRENQEPALVIIDAHAIPFEKIQELLEWMPTVIVLHTQAETVLSWGIKVDVLLVPAGEEADWIASTKDQQPIEMIPLGNESSLKSAFEFVDARNIAAVNCLVADEQALSVAIDINHDVEAFFDNKRWSRIKSGRFEKWIAAKSQLSILPKEVHTEISGISNGKYITGKDGIVVLQATIPFWVGEELI